MRRAIGILALASAALVWAVIWSDSRCSEWQTVAGQPMFLGGVVIQTERRICARKA